jgi:tetratricopeptide (TPR) repeat protein
VPGERLVRDSAPARAGLLYAGHAALTPLLLSLALGVPAVRLWADTIYLKNGRVIEAERAWSEGQQVLYQRNGATFGLPRNLVQRVEQVNAAAPATDPDVRRARASLAAGDAAAAVRLLAPLVARDPSSLAAAQSLAEAYLRLGDAHSARRIAVQALRLDARDARSHQLVGDALAALGDTVGAESAYRKSLQLHADTEVERRLAAVRAAQIIEPEPEVLAEAAPRPSPSAPPVPGPGNAQFRLRYDGSVNEPLGGAVVQALAATHAEYARRLGASPNEPITVVLQTEEAFRATHPAAWVAGVNDGTIRVPVRGLARATPELMAVLRHELAHSFVSARTGGNCPTWLQEGIAQWLQGGAPGRGDAALAPLARSGRLRSLAALEGPFQALTEADASLAYAQSLSAVAHILRRRGEAGLVRLLAALGDGLPSEEALPVALGFSYPELQRDWEAALH